MGDYADCVWRVDRKHGRIIYAIVDDIKEPGTEDVAEAFLGLMQTKGIAQDVVDAHNDNLSPPIHLREAIAERHGQNRG